MKNDTKTDLNPLAGKVAFVTGASRNLVAAIAKRLAATTVTTAVDSVGANQEFAPPNTSNSSSGQL